MISDRPATYPPASLPDVHASVPASHSSVWRRLLAFSGPAYLVSVGYIDPGNWATDLEGGARFGYQLLWVLVLSNLMAILLQTLSARLGIVTQRDLAQACRETYPKPISYALWILCEIAIAACDLAEVLGAAIALNLLFHIPLLPAVLLTAFDTLLVLWFTRFGIRAIESFVLALVVVIAGCFAIEIFLVHPSSAGLLSGLVPHVTSRNLYLAIAIIGATVMPHNLYLHSALVQTRRIGSSDRQKRAACRFNLIDSTIALNGAMFVNGAILILACTVFFRRGIVVTEISQAHLLLAPLLGSALAGVLFAVALLCSGQSSTLTGTMAGQIVMEGFLDFRMQPWLRRIITRSAAIIPAVLTLWYVGEHAISGLIILTQVILNLQLPFAIIPLIQFTSSRKRMGDFANRFWVKALAWGCALLIVGLDLWLVVSVSGEWVRHAATRGPREALLALTFISLGSLLAWITFEPVLPVWLRMNGKPALVLPKAVALDLPDLSYRKILVPLDHTHLDRAAITHAAAMARLHNARLYLLHVEEGMTSLLYGQLSSTAEVAQGRAYFEDILHSLEREGLNVEIVTRHSRKPKQEIVAYAQELQPDLVVMGAHGHKGLKDIVFGTTINAVRHKLNVPVLIVRQ